ncbi:hypothetical protein B5X24_HaOG213476 [Helicoverpa armigera]|uniref:Uncharacterized protein n=1 Tax=Helicoverpa armigera TaxID=29058 RepID=A0A2W1BIB6_HELAM|nr:hypothetical protein B5X24_HaOG213476 [Helicoverpa armigera]
MVRLNYLLRLVQHNNFVVFCLQIFIFSAHYADGRPVSGTIKNTTETVLFFDRLFDSVNGAGSAKEARGKLRTAVTKKSPHHKFWPEAVRKFENLKFIDSAGKEKSVPSVKKYLTLKSYMRQ